MTRDEMQAKALEMKAHSEQMNALAMELWDAGCCVRVKLASIVSGGFGANGYSPAKVFIDAFLPAAVEK